MSQNEARHEAHARPEDEDAVGLGARVPEHTQGRRPRQPVGQPGGDGGVLPDEPGQPDEEEFELAGDNDLGPADLGPLGPNASDPDARSEPIRKMTGEGGRDTRR